VYWPTDAENVRADGKTRLEDALVHAQRQLSALL
jgi:hypothetical protein